MKKVAILSAVNIKHMSLISLYSDYFNANGISFDILYMDKYDEYESYNCNHIYRYVNKVNHNLPAPIKVLQYAKFYFYATKVINKNKYDYVVVWNDIAILIFGRYLSKKMPGRYCLNIRDYCGERIPIIFKIFSTAIKESSFTTVSSDGFREFLPNFDYITISSYNKTVLETCRQRNCLRECTKPIRIGFIGNVRFFDINRRLIDVFKNDNRFELHYYGVNASVLSKYASNVGADNVFCGESFPQEETGLYLEKTDIMNNLYGVGAIELDTAVSIKLFHAAYIRIPIMVFKGTYMQTISEKYCMGYAVNDITSEFPNSLYNWYHLSLKYSDLARGCDALIEHAETQNSKLETALNNVLTTER